MTVVDWERVKQHIAGSIRADLLIETYTPNQTANDIIGKFFVDGVKESIDRGIDAYCRETITQ